MNKDVKCSQCRNLKDVNNPRFNNVQEISIQRQIKKFRCEADIPNYFSCVEVKKIRNCDKFRPRTLSFWQELLNKLLILPKWIANYFLNKIK